VGEVFELLARKLRRTNVLIHIELPDDRLTLSLWYTITAIKLSSKRPKTGLFLRIFGSANSWHLILRTIALSL
jgi:hypothetical protein